MGRVRPVVRSSFHQPGYRRKFAGAEALLRYVRRTSDRAKAMAVQGFALFCAECSSAQQLWVASVEDNLEYPYNDTSDSYLLVRKSRSLAPVSKYLLGTSESLEYCLPVSVCLTG